MSLSPENKALIERELGPLWVRLLDGDGRLNLIIDAARQEGSRGGEPVAWSYEYTNHRVGDRAPGGWLRAVALNPPTRAQIEGGFARDVRALYAAPAEPSGWTQAREFVRFVGRLDHTGDDGWAPGGDEDSCVLDNLIARARDIMASLPPTSEGGGA